MRSPTKVYDNYCITFYYIMMILYTTWTISNLILINYDRTIGGGAISALKLWN